MSRIVRQFSVDDLPMAPAKKTALLINPPVYDTQYWAEWSQPYGLVRIAALLRRKRYKRLEFFDFMEALSSSDGEGDGTSKRVVPKHRIHCDEDYGTASGPVFRARPYVLEKDDERLQLFKYHFGKPWIEFERWLTERELVERPPDEIYIASVMSYWWESTRDLIARIRRVWGTTPKIIVGGIYPSIAPEHAARFTGADIIVSGEVHEANDLWTDLSVYETEPAYAIKIGRAHV